MPATYMLQNCILTFDVCSRMICYTVDPPLSKQLWSGQDLLKCSEKWIYLDKWSKAKHLGYNSAKLIKRSYII